MSYFRIFVALLASASLVSAAPFRYCELSDAEVVGIDDIIRQGDDPALIREILDDCHLHKNFDNIGLLHQMIWLDRPQSFALFFDRVNFNPQIPIENIISTDLWGAAARDKTDLLTVAYGKHCVEICRFLLDQDFEPVHELPSLRGPWTLEELRDLITGHHDKAWLFLAPLCYPGTRAAFLDVEAIMRKIEVNLHCRVVNETIRSDVRFHPTTMLMDLIRSRDLGRDEDFVVIFNRLIAAGAAVTEQMHADFAARNPHHEMAERLLFYASQPEVKEPGKD